MKTLSFRSKDPTRSWKTLAVTFYDDIVEFEIAGLNDTVFVDLTPSDALALAHEIIEAVEQQTQWKPGDPDLKDVVSMIEPADTPLLNFLRKR